MTQIWAGNTPLSSCGIERLLSDTPELPDGVPLFLPPSCASYLKAVVVRHQLAYGSRCACASFQLEQLGPGATAVKWQVDPEGKRLIIRARLSDNRKRARLVTSASGPSCQRRGTRPRS